MLDPADIGIDTEELHRRATMFAAQGLAGSMKPILLEALLARRGGPVVFIDADGCVYDDLTPVAELAERCSVVLSPHILDPNPAWWLQDSAEQVLLRAGVFNGGFMAVGAAGEPFLRWWANRTSRRCVFDEQQRLIVEQTWLMLVPALFRHGVLRDPGVNVAGWNLHNRDVDWDGDKPWIGGRPLRHFHFACSYDPENPQRLTQLAHAHWWPQLSDRPGAARLSRVYAERLLESGYREAQAQPVRYDTMPDGAPIKNWMRAVYRQAVIDAERDGGHEPPNPFTHGSERFATWTQERAVEGIEQIGPPTLAADDRTDGLSSLHVRELASAITDADELLARIRELEGIRDDAIGWAQRVSAELEAAKRVITRRGSLIGKLRSRLGRAGSQSS